MSARMPNDWACAPGKGVGDACTCARFLVRAADHAPSVPCTASGLGCPAPLRMPHRAHGGGAPCRRRECWWCRLRVPLLLLLLLRRLGCWAAAAGAQRQLVPG